MRFLVDSNVLVTASMGQAPGHEEAKEFMTRTLAAASPWCLTWVNIYEFLRVVTHRKVFPRPLSFSVAFEQVARLMEHRWLDLLSDTPRHLQMLDLMAGKAGSVSGNFVHDCHIAALMKEHDVTTIITRDTHLRRFGEFKVLSPGEALG